MLRLLLGEHLSPLIAEQVRAHNAAVEIHSLQEWQEGRYIGATDEDLLDAAHAAHPTLISYDQRTIFSLIERRAAKGQAHGGLVMVSGKTIASSNIGALVRALLSLWAEQGQDDWTDQIVYLNA